MIFALFHRFSDGTRIVKVRDESKASELVELARQGDTLHKFSASLEPAELLRQCEGQLQRKEFKQL